MQPPHSMMLSARNEKPEGMFTERFCDLEIDDQLKVGRLLDRQIRRLGALENLPDIDADPTIKRGQTLQRCLAEWESHGPYRPCKYWATYCTRSAVGVLRYSFAASTSS